MVVAEDRGNPQAKAAAMIPVEVLADYWTPLDDLIPSALQRDPAWQTHWEPLARGLSVVAPESGWYFTGREHALRKLVSWLTGPPGVDAKGRAVTGGPGSGKSAVLARLVTLSEPAHRRRVPLGDAPPETVPPAGLIDVAVHARAKTLAQIVEEIADAVDAGARNADELLAELVGAGQPLIVVVDALDEAAGGGGDLAGLLQRLAAEGGQVGIRVLVGTRRPLLPRLGNSAFEVIDLDESPYLEFTDLVEYVTRRLLSADISTVSASYRDEPDLVRRLAEAVARRATPTFLIAQLTALWLAGQPPVAVDWAESDHLPETVGDAMDRYLTLFGNEERRARDLLRPLAYAEGAGLPATELWTELATALAPLPQRYTYHDLSWLLASAAAFLVESSPATASESTADLPRASAYRLFHTALDEHLRPEDQEQPAQQRTVDILRRRVPAMPSGLDWASSEPYARTYLASHAAAAGQLDSLLNDPGYLIHADPDRLLVALPTAYSQSARSNAAVYRKVAQHLRHSDPAVRASHLELAAHQAGARELAHQLDEAAPARPWSTRWVRWQPSHDHLPLRGHNGWVTTVAMGKRRDGTLVIVSGSSDRTVRLWELDTGVPVGEPLRGHDGPVHTVTFGTHGDGTDLIVTGGSDSTIRLWELETGIPVAPEANLRIGSIVIGLAVRGPNVIVAAHHGIAVLTCAVLQ
jgi:hypothetical protein